MNLTEEDQIFLNIAKEISKKSKCISFQVGCIIVKNGRILSSGYNGSPSGYDNCNKCFNRQKFDRIEHSKWSDENEIHAEMNSIIYAAKEGVSISGSIMYCTLQPCNNCLKNIIASGIKRIVYAEKYDRAKYSDFLSSKLTILDHEIKIL